jgi:pimeloyl-ACP methyl ester carboxylesterase
MYNDFHEPPIIMETLTSIGWHAPCNFMAHSRGGSIAALTVSTFPERFSRLILFDSSMAVRKEAAQIATDMRAAFNADQKNAAKRPRVFPNLRDMVIHNFSNVQFPKELHTAAAIARRHAMPLQDGMYTFSHDVRTYGESQPLGIAPRQQDQFFANLRVPTLLVMGTDSRIGAWAIKEKDVAMAKFQKSAHAAFPTDSHTRRAFVDHLEQRWKDFQHRLRSAATEIDVRWCEGGRHHFHSDLPEKASRIVLGWISDSFPRIESTGINTQAPFAIPKQSQLLQAAAASAFLDASASSKQKSRL